VSPASSAQPPPRDASHPQSANGLPLPRWVFWLMLPGIVAPLLVFVFILVTQLAHDPARCPFHEQSRQTLAVGVAVVVEVRSCIAHVQEHRYRLLRGKRSQILGERRLAEAVFGQGYSWIALLSPQGEVKVVVHNQAHEDVTFREGTAAERAR
jgi:hypothetical protein